MFSHRSGRVAQADSVAVIGLGRFGGSLALELEAQGTEVLGIDSSEEIVQSYNGRLTHVVRADSTREEVLRQLSVHEFDRAVVGIGSDLEASILTTELRGGTAVNIFGKRLSRAVHRQAITVVLLAIALVVASTMFLMLITDFGQERILFEVVSAFATVGLSTGITAGMPPAGQVVLILLMFIGRLGPVTLGTALALRSRPILYEYPKERPLIG